MRKLQNIVTHQYTVHTLAFITDSVVNC